MHGLVEMPPHDPGRVRAEAGAARVARGAAVDALAKRAHIRGCGGVRPVCTGRDP